MKCVAIALVAVALLSSETVSLSIEKVDKVEKESVEKVETPEKIETPQKVETPEKDTQWKRKLIRQAPFIPMATILWFFGQHSLIIIFSSFQQSPNNAQKYVVSLIVQKKTRPRYVPFSAQKQVRIC